MRTARSAVPMALSLLTLVATGASAKETCSVAKKLTCIRHCPTVDSCMAKATSVCPTGDCSAKDIRKGCRKEVGRCRTRCRTPCMRSCEGLIHDCVEGADPGCVSELAPLTCGSVWKNCQSEAVFECRRKACCPLPVHVTMQVSCQEEPCSCIDGAAGRTWTYAASGTASGSVGTTLELDDHMWQVQCREWTPGVSSASLATCTRSTAQPVEISWTATAPGRSDCYCADAPAVSTFAANASDGESIDATTMVVTCP